MYYIQCTKCGKRVSNFVETEIVVRAYVECPECVEKEKEPIEKLSGSSNTLYYQVEIVKKINELLDIVYKLN